MIVALRALAVMAYGASTFALGAGVDGAYYLACATGIIAGVCIVWEGKK